MVHVTALQILTSNTVVRGTRKDKLDGTKEVCADKYCTQVTFS